MNAKILLSEGKEFSLFFMFVFSVLLVASPFLDSSQQANSYFKR